MPRKAQQAGPFTAFAVQGPLDFALTGILATLLQPLADAEISVFTISTFDTDWILVPRDVAAERPRPGDDDGHRSSLPRPITPQENCMSVTHPAGFTAAGVPAGLKTTGGKDVALVVNNGPTHDSASVFTANRCKANPVLWSEEVVKDGTVRAVVLNSGGANCYTGADGFQTTHAVAEQVADGLGIGAIDVVVCSTGLIGLANPRENAAPGCRRLRRRAERRRRPRRGRGDHDHRLGEQAGRRRGQRLVDRRHGQGCRHARARSSPPCSSCSRTDAVVPAADLDTALRAATGASFDRLDSDGCMSTNDTVTVMASGASGVTPVAAGLRRGPDRRRAPTSRCSCSRTPRAPTTRSPSPCCDAATEDEAVEVGRSVARSNLFKAAVFGKDPNWGRVLASIGTTSAAFDPADLDVAMNGVWVCRSSTPAEDPAKVDLSPAAR